MLKIDSSQKLWLNSLLIFNRGTDNIMNYPRVFNYPTTASTTRATRTISFLKKKSIWTLTRINNPWGGNATINAGHVTAWAAERPLSQGITQTPSRKSCLMQSDVTQEPSWTGGEQTGVGSLNSQVAAIPVLQHYVSSPADGRAWKSPLNCNFLK